VSPAIAPTWAVVRTQPETVRARLAMSEASGVVYTSALFIEVLEAQGTPVSEDTLERQLVVV
jgi:hypothetical protein